MVWFVKHKCLKVIKIQLWVQPFCAQQLGPHLWVWHHQKGLLHVWHVNYAMSHPIVVHSKESEPVWLHPQESHILLRHTSVACILIKPPYKACKWNYLHIFRQLCVPFKTVITSLPWPLLCVTSHMLTMFTNTASDTTVMYNMVGWTRSESKLHYCDMSLQLKSQVKNC